MIETEVINKETLGIQVAAFSCIFSLMQTYSYEYGPFYFKLYSLADLTCDGYSAFDLENKTGLAYAKLIELSLKSATLSHALICAFIKVNENIWELIEIS